MKAKFVVKPCVRSKKGKFKVVKLDGRGKQLNTHSYYKTKPSAEKAAKELNKGLKFLRG